MPVTRKDGHLTGHLLLASSGHEGDVTPEWRRDFMIQKAPDAWRGRTRRTPRVDGLHPLAADSELGRCGARPRSAGRSVRAQLRSQQAALPAGNPSPRVRPGCLRPARAPLLAAPRQRGAAQRPAETTARHNRLCDRNPYRARGADTGGGALFRSRGVPGCAVPGGRPRDCRASQHSPMNA